MTTPRSTGARAPRRSRVHRPGGRSARVAGPELGSYRLTIRHGSDVERTSFDSLDEAVAVLHERAERIRAEADLPRVQMIRTYQPAQRVKARLEISTGGFLRGSDAGVDVMGDGRLVPYAGGVRKRELEAAPGESLYDAVRGALDRRGGGLSG